MVQAFRRVLNKKINNFQRFDEIRIAIDPERNNTAYHRQILNHLDRRDAAD